MSYVEMPPRLRSCALGRATSVSTVPLEGLAQNRFWSVLGGLPSISTFGPSRPLYALEAVRGAPSGSRRIVSNKVTA